MGSITRSLANNFTTSGVLLPAALVNNSIANVTSYNASVSTAGMVLLSSQTASASATISFTTGIDSTYKEYQFYFINIHGSNNTADFVFNVSTDGGANYNVTKTTTHFRAYHTEANATGFGYETGEDLAQSTAFKKIFVGLENNNDNSGSAFMHLFNPSSTTYVKHFIATTSFIQTADVAQNAFIAGYANTTSAVNAIQFKMSSGYIDDGTILMYGIL